MSDRLVWLAIDDRNSTSRRFTKRLRFIGEASDDLWWIPANSATATLRPLSQRGYRPAKVDERSYVEAFTRTRTNRLLSQPEPPLSDGFHRHDDPEFVACAAEYGQVVRCEWTWEVEPTDEDALEAAVRQLARHNKVANKIRLV
ncbi:MAG: hypothetical protein KC766_19930 [Myxococcales bacterium]|nr:hypothetical protein [Myxococcales bacterium]